MPRPRVFVSHSHHDTDFTNRLVADLSAAGADVWVDVVGIDRGDFQERINEALGACQYFVLVLTPEALRSPWVRMETHAAIKRQTEGQIRQVLPVLAHPVESRMIPPIWNTFPRLDATSDYGSALAGMVLALGLPLPPSRPPVAQPTAAPVARVAARGDKEKTTRISPHTTRLASFFALALLVAASVTFIAFTRGLVFANQNGGTLKMPPASLTATAAAVHMNDAVAAVQHYCAALQAKHYADAYQMWSASYRSRASQSEYILSMVQADQQYGPLTICTPVADAAVNRIVNDTMVFQQFQLKRSKQRNAATGAIKLVFEDNSWKIDDYDFSLWKDMY